MKLYDFKDGVVSEIDRDNWPGFNGNWQIAVDEIGDARVSTVFLGMDHGFGSKVPILFETMIFGGQYDQEQVRYETNEEAAAGHEYICLILRGAPPADEEETPTVDSTTVDEWVKDGYARF